MDPNPDRLAVPSPDAGPGSSGGRRTGELLQPVGANRQILLVLWTLLVTFIPVLLVVLSGVVHGLSLAAGRGVSWAEALMVLPFLAAALAAVVTGFRINRAVTNRGAWALALCTVALLLAASTPFAYVLTKTAAETLCESTPGGVWYSGTQGPGDAPGVCQWARS